ncbi:glycerol-3-phosphate acyltransferase [Virgibacillus sp. SK37]|uniref:glycerol-3-phosphate acyltransferase n=1 Tax=Virgibacillus sp. SK37 TaxID=403957 RepID=UPI0004D1A5DB|nr:glycerol-3-phosphate acyltransferase [Virgibacillus sp. SK37]AIF45361.1 hypothetical protein X953_07900 [Virgibacillus sp. SK37]
MLVFIFIVGAYLFGCMNGAYYVGKLLANMDVRELGSSNAGARNAGRVFGREAFIYTVLIDAVKTVVPLVTVTYILGDQQLILGLIAGSVMVGHVWPVQLQFQGGKGVVVYLAAALVLAPEALLVTGIVVLILYKLEKNITIAGLIGISAIPVMLLITAEFILATAFSILLFIVIFLHRNGEGR